MSRFWREVLSAKGITYEQETIEEFGYVNGKYQRLSQEKLDSTRITVGDNYGNKIYTNKEGANLIYKSTKLDPPISYNSRGKETFEMIHKMTSILKSANIDYKVYC